MEETAYGQPDVQCPECFEFNPPYATKCKNCGTLMEAGLKKANFYRLGREHSRALEFERARAEALLKEVTYVPADLRRQLKVVQFFKDSPGVRKAFNCLVSALFGVAMVSLVGDLLDDESWIFVPYIAGAASFYFMFMLNGYWAANVLDIIEDHLLGQKEKYLKWGEAGEHQKRNHGRSGHGRQLHTPAKHKESHPPEVHPVKPHPHPVKHLDDLVKK